MKKKIITIYLLILITLIGHTKTFQDTINPQTKIETLIDSLIKTSDEQKKAFISINIAEQLSKIDWNRCAKYITNAEEYINKSNSNPSKIYLRIANIYDNKDMLDLALKYYLKAYKYYKNKINNNEKANIENNIAIAYARLENSKKAYEFFNKTRKYYRLKQDSLNLIKVYNNLGLLFKEINKDSSIVFFNEALSLSKDYDDSLKLYIYTNLGRVYSSLNDSIKSSYYFNKAINNIENGKDNKIKAWVYKSIAKDLYRKKLTDSAITIAFKGLNLIQKEKLSFTYKDLMQILFKSFYKKKDFESASKYFLLYDNIRDSLNIEEKAANAIKIKIEQDYIIKEQNLKLKEKERIIKLTIIGFVVLLSLSILIILVIIYKNKLNKVRLREELIKSKKEELNKVLESKQRLLIAKAMKEIYINEIIQSILQELNNIKRKALKKETKLAINTIQRKLEKDINSKAWNEFEISFEKVNPKFYENLTKKHPNITIKDKRLASLLVLGLSSKEIAQITSQDVKSIENARTRLRKKLNITNRKISLVDYLISLNT